MGQTDKYRYIIQILVQQKSKYISQVMYSQLTQEGTLFFPVEQNRKQKNKCPRQFNKESANVGTDGLTDCIDIRKIEFSSLLTPKTILKH